MNRSGQTVSAVIAIIGIAKVCFPAVLVSLFALDKSVALIAIAIAILAFGVWYGPLGFLSGSSVTGFLGLAVLVLGGFSISSPTLLGLRGTYLPIADIFLLLESGILLQMIGLEKKQSQTLSPLAIMSLASQLVMRRYHHATNPVAAVATSR